MSRNVSFVSNRVLVESILGNRNKCALHSYVQAYLEKQASGILEMVIAFNHTHHKIITFRLSTCHDNLPLVKIEEAIHKL